MNTKAIIIKSLTDGVDQFNELINNLNEENFKRKKTGNFFLFKF